MGASFNPRAREGRDAIVIKDNDAAGVSIHAPARGATRRSAHILLLAEFQSTRPRGARPLKHLNRLLPKMFQSTRPRGARLRKSSAILNFRGFNPRAREGRDRIIWYRPAMFTVSIHAPARGATMVAVKSKTGQVFQSTRPRGARHSIRRSGSMSACFNPRAREGRDVTGEDCRRRVVVSIHAPARGATNLKVLIITQKKVSIHAPARGATADGFALRGQTVVSIHAPARGATKRRS